MIGIYCILNTVNGKRYIGKSIRIERRLKHHRYLMCLPELKPKQINRHLYSAGKKYGIDAFDFSVIEEISDGDFTEELLAQRELFWIDYYRTTDRSSGYNLRRDSETKNIVHEETRKIISENNLGDKNPNYGNRWTAEMKEKMSEHKKSWAKDNPVSEERRKQISELSKKLWSDLDKKEKMARKVAQTTSLLRFYEYDKISLELKRVWESMDEILQANPGYHRIAIYSVCNGHKKSYRGSVWRSEYKEKHE